MGFVWRRVVFAVVFFAAWVAFRGALVLAAPAADTTHTPVDSPPHVARPIELTPGERLVYEIKWSGMPAGQAVLSVKWKRDFEGSEAYHIECETRTNAFMAVFYPVEDKTITIIDAEGSFSRLFQMSKNEGRIKQSESIRFDYAEGLAVYEQRRLGPFDMRTRKLVRMDGHVQDPLSCLYYLRAMELSPGASVRMPVHTARRSWTLTVEVLRREELAIPGFGTLKTLRVEPTMRFPGIFVRKGRMVVWIEEETHIPVRMHVDVPIGSVTVTLADAENAPIRRASEAAAER